MKEQKQDRRSRRTRHLVTTAMMELMHEKRYDAITVHDLLERSGIGRSTFYSHYDNKQDVLAMLVEEQLARFTRQLSQRDAGKGIVPSLELFRHVQEHAAFHRALVHGRSGEVIWEAAQEPLTRNIEETLASACKEGDLPAVPLPVVAQYLAGAFVNLLTWWISAEMPYAPEEMERMFQQLALPGVWAVIGATKG